MHRNTGSLDSLLRVPRTNSTVHRNTYVDLLTSFLPEERNLIRTCFRQLQHPPLTRHPCLYPRTDFIPLLTPFPSSPPSRAVQMSRQSQAWFFNNLADGTNAYAGGAQGWAPDGCSCDNAEPNGCNYKQGDGNVPIHDWTFEETLSAVVMQAELLLVTRNTSEMLTYSARFLRVSNFMETRRDPATGMRLFLTGPSSNLLAPSFGGWTLDNGRHAWSYMAGISVTYTAALNRLIEVETMLGNAALATLYTQRRNLNLQGLHELYDPSGAYLVRSLDPNGTKHGVLGQARHGYFEASPNHDAIAWRVVNDTQAVRMFAAMTSLGAKLRPNVFVRPTASSRGLMCRAHMPVQASFFTKSSLHAHVFLSN